MTPTHPTKEKIKKESLKDWCKDWTITEIANSIFSAGMGFMANHGDDIKSKEFQAEKWILVKELKKRLK